MSYKSVFNSANSVSGKVASLPATDTVNLAGGQAYSLSAKQAVAQFAVTGTFNGTYYASANDQLNSIKALLAGVEPEFIAKLAVYSRKSAHMKDMPAFLLASLSTRDINLFKKVFPLVIDNGKMLRNFVQIMRSGTAGRKSLGSAPKKAIKAWVDSRSDEQLFNDSVGNDPSLVDVIKMVHVKAGTPSREALFKYLMGFEGSKTLEFLPKIVKEFEAFKSDVVLVDGAMPPDKISFEMLTALPLTDLHWKKIATDAKWHMTRMNINTFARHGVFSDPAMVDMVATRLKDKKSIAHARVFPYQLFAAYTQTGGDEDSVTTTTSIPLKVRNALQDALEISTENVPSFNGKKVAIGVDISGSMHCAITGNRGTATSKIKANDVAALFAACLLKANADNCDVYQFDTTCKPLTTLNAKDSLITNLTKISFEGGGTDCASTLALLNRKSDKSDIVIIVSDYESWAQLSQSAAWQGNPKATQMAVEWTKFKARNPNAKLICLDLVPHTTTQVNAQKDVLCVGGFSDQVFDVIKSFVDADGNDPDFFVKTIEESVKF